MVLFKAFQFSDDKYKFSIESTYNIHTFLMSYIFEAYILPPPLAKYAVKLKDTEADTNFMLRGHALASRVEKMLLQIDWQRSTLQIIDFAF